MQFPSMKSKKIAIFLSEQMEKMREVNNRLTKRNQDLAKKVAEMQSRLNSQVNQASDQHWFG